MEPKKHPDYSTKWLYCEGRISGKESIMTKVAFLVSSVLLFAVIENAHADIPISDATQECLECHTSIHPGIVEGWQKSRHAKITPKQALGAAELARKVSSKSIPEGLQSVAVGCAECHTLRPKAHSDTVEHNDYEIHVVVSPKDCATCHAVEDDEYSKNLMAHAYKNLAGNAVFQDLQRSIIGKPVFNAGKVRFEPEDASTKAEACFYCHGTKLKVEGIEARETDMGEMEFARISGWPNQGVGRINLDGSLGACSACHTRHRFSIEMARKPHTCMECHVGPDVPANRVYKSSKHGNIYSAMNKSWNFNAVPWTVGKDFTAPTCAVCHISLLIDTEDSVIVQRTHQVTNRLSSRIFGLIYAHPQPKIPDTTVIRNQDNLPLPTDFEGNIAAAYLLDKKQQKERTRTMQAACLACHGRSWVLGHWNRYENAIRETNASTRTATHIMKEIWKHGFAEGIDEGGSPFDEAVEKKWTDIWLFHTNTIRFSAAMAGGGDYSVFANGRYELSKRIQELNDILRQRKITGWKTK